MHSPVAATQRSPLFLLEIGSGGKVGYALDGPVLDPLPSLKNSISSLVRPLLCP